jgi:L-ascorbate metabolism protein UlaG (beta-lactamase superfamily)
LAIDNPDSRLYLVAGVLSERPFIEVPSISNFETMWEQSMERILVGVAAAALLAGIPVFAQESFEKDVIKTSAGPLEITFVGHGTLMMKFAGKTIYVDPSTRVADFSKLPKADCVFITHQHFDHFDSKALALVRTDLTKVVLTPACAKEFTSGIVMKNGDVRNVLGIHVEALPAYNLVSKRPDGTPFHPPGEGNGYVLTFGKTRVYIAGDTENIPEMKALKHIDIAFLPMNLPYTMTPEMVADAAMAFKPKILYPYHYGETDTGQLAALLRGVHDIELRIRKMK